MDIKPIKSIKPVTKSQIGEDVDVTRKPKAKSTPTQPLDEGFSLQNRKLLLDGKDIGKLITETQQQNPEQLAALAARLEKYKNDRLKRRNKLTQSDPEAVMDAEDDEISLVWALCDAFIARIAQLIKRQYDQKKDGLTVYFDEDGQLVVNGINISAFIETCRDNLTPKAKIMLKGMRTRLSYILHNRFGNPYYIQIQDTVQALYDEIGAILR